MRQIILLAVPVLEYFFAWRITQNLLQTQAIGLKVERDRFSAIGSPRSKTLIPLPYLRHDELGLPPPVTQDDRNAENSGSGKKADWVREAAPHIPFNLHPRMSDNVRVSYDSENEQCRR
jgi:hypothetical protein